MTWPEIHTTGNPTHLRRSRVIHWDRLLRPLSSLSVSSVTSCRILIKTARFGTKTGWGQNWTPHIQRLAPIKTVRSYHFPVTHHGSLFDSAFFAPLRFHWPVRTRLASSGNGTFR